MIKVNKKKAKVKGKPKKLLYEISVIIQIVYMEANKQSPNLAEKIKENIIAIVTAPDSPLWKDGTE